MIEKIEFEVWKVSEEYGEGLVNIGDLYPFSGPFSAREDAERIIEKADVLVKPFLRLATVTRTVLSEESLQFDTMSLWSL